MSASSFDSSGRRLSRFGSRFLEGAGTYQLMADLSAAAEQPDSLMLGGGNPARIAEVENIFRRELRRLADEDELIRRWGASYSAPEGDLRCREAFASLLRTNYGWPISRANIALTPGSQTAFFMLFNAFAGHSPRGEPRSVWLPFTPEYVGYADVGVNGPLTRGAPSRIHELGDNLFKYRLHPAALEIAADVGAVCLSRPTNPTGNVVTGEELALVDQAARRAGVPLILDCAYGLPFPNIVYADARPFWNDNVILCLSLSKLGLPGLRTGIVIASEDVITLLGSMMASMNLAPPSIGPTLIEGLVRSGEILILAETIVRPHYEQRAQQALECMREAFAGLDWRVHVPEGAFFLWMWFPNLPIPSWGLYKRLKARGLFVLSGHYFFPPALDDVSHHRECIRVSYAQSPEAVRRGLEIIADEIRSL
jgi:valine--pyruvate aminotransferase